MEFAIEMRELEHMIVHDAFEMPAEDLAGIDFIESIIRRVDKVCRSLA